MHPILAQKEVRLIYLSGWSLLASLVTLALIWGPAGHTEALVLAVPLAMVNAFMGLAAWYTCRAYPLSRPNLGRTLAAVVTSAGLSSILWVGLGLAWAGMLSRTAFFPSAARHFLSVFPQLFGLGVVLYLLALALHYILMTWQRTMDAERRELELAMQARDAELRALRAQIHPHFLFNSLNATAALTIADPAAAHRMCLMLAQFLRHCLEVGPRETVPLAEELALTREYLAIERVRFGDKLKVEETVSDEARLCLIPPLILQPLVENAVNRGIAQMLEEGTVIISAALSGTRLNLVLENPYDPQQPSGRGSGRGLPNVKGRLAQSYGGAAEVVVRCENSRFRVEISLPAEKSAEP